LLALGVQRAGPSRCAKAMKSRRVSPPRRRASKAKRPGASNSGRWGRWIKASIGLAVALACAWVGYILWGGRGPKPPEPPPEAGPSEPLAGQMKVTLYFSDSQAEFLLGEDRIIPRVDGAAALARAVVEEVARGPRTALQPTLPKGTRVLKVDVRGDGLCIVDLSEEIQRDHPGGSSGELMSVYSIVETIAANVPGIKSVQIMIEGKKTETLAGHISIGGPIRPEPSYVRSR
jgi:germination protein M